ncbi:MAG: DUF3299 domain-containing protein [Fuerstiella sp.]
MKSDFAKTASSAATIFALCLCISLSGCSDSGSGMPYSQLAAPKSASFTTWSPLPKSEQDVSDRSSDLSNDQDSQTQTEGTPDQPAKKETDSDTPKVQQIAAGANDRTASTVTQAVATDTTNDLLISEPDLLTPDMTAQERMNVLMNNPDLEESTEVLEIKLLVPNKRFRKEDKGKVTRVSYDDIDLLKILNMQPVPADAVSHLPDWLTALEGQRIRIRGFMIPPYQSEGLKRFALARDNGICCFVRTPKIYDVINVRMAENQVTDYIANKPFDVEGIFRIDPYYEDGEWYSLYELEDATVSQ